MYKTIDMDSLKLNQNFRWIVEKKNFFSQEECDEMKNIVESYVSSFYLEKMYRTNRFFNEKFTPIYTTTGLIRNIWADLFFADDDLITH